MDYSVLDLLTTLEVVEFANLNNYQLFGLNNDNAPADISTGWSNKLSGSSNSTSGNHASYRGVEDLFTQYAFDGCVYDGAMNGSNGDLIFYKDPRDYGNNDGSANSFVDVGSGFPNCLTTENETKYPFMTIFNGKLNNDGWDNEGQGYSSYAHLSSDFGAVFAFDSDDSDYLSPFGSYDAGVALSSGADFGGRLVKKPLQ